MSLKFEITGDNTNFLRALEEARNGVRQTAREIEQSGNSIEGLFNKLGKAAAAIGLGFTATEFVNQVANVRGEFQKLEVAFKTMLGNGERANALMQQLIHTAAITPFGMSEVTQGAKQLLAYGTAADEVNETLIRLGDIAAGLSIPLGEFVQLYGTTMTQGRMFTQDLRQFMGRGIPMADELARIFGVAKSEVGELVTAGKVGAEEVRQAIWNMTNEGSKFGGLMEEQSKTISGQIANIEDAIEQMFNDMGKQSEGIINTALSAASWAIEHYKAIGSAIAYAAATYGTYKAILMTVTAMQAANNMVVRQAALEKSLAAMQGIALSNAEAIAAARTKLLTIAQQGLVKALKATAAATIANPYVLMATAITGLISVVYQYATAASAAEVAQEGFNGSIEKMNNALEERRQKINDLISTIQNVSTTDLQKKLAFDDLEKVAPSLTEVYDTIDKIVNLKSEDKDAFVNQMQDEDTLSNLREQARLYKEIHDRLEKLGGVHQSAIGSGASDRSEVEGLQRRLRDMGINGSWTWGTEEWAEAAWEALGHVNEKLAEINAAKEELAVPTELEIEVAENDFKAANEAFEDLSTFASALKAEIEEPMSMDVDGSIARKETDSVVEDIREKLRDLQKEQNESPITFTADKEKALNTYSTMLEQIERWREQARTSGLFTIPIFFQQVQNERDQKKATFDSKKSVADSAKEQAKTYADSYKAARKAFKDAQKKLSNIKRNKDDYTAEEYKAAAEELKNTKEEFEKLGGDTKQTSREAKEAKEREKRAKERKKAQEELNEELLDLRRENERQNIALLRKGADKELKEIAFAAKRKEDAIKKQAKELAKKNKEAGTGGLNGNGLTAEQQNAIDEALRLNEESAEKQRNDFTKNLLRSEAEAMLDYLKEYGTMQEQKYAIAKEYAEKIRQVEQGKGTDEEKRWRVRSLERERDNAIGSSEARQMAMDIDWGVAFEGVGNVLGDIARETLQKVEEYMKTSEFKGLSAESKKSYSDLRTKLVDETGGNSTSAFNFKIWSTIADNVKAYQKAVKELQARTEEHNRAIENLKAAEKELEEATDDTAKSIAKAAVKAAKTDADATGNAVTQAQQNAANAQNDLTNNTEKAANGLDNFATYVSEMANGSLYGFANGITQLVTSLSKGSDGVGKSLGQLGGKVGGLIGAILQIIDALGDDPAQFIHDLLMKISNVVEAILSDLPNLVKNIVEGVLNIVGGIFDGIWQLFGGNDASDAINGSNAKDVQRSIDRLTDRNESLQTAIEDLTETIESGEGMKSVEAYQEAAELQEQANQNYLDIAKAQAGYHGSHHSWQYYWYRNDTANSLRELQGLEPYVAGGFTQSEIDDFSKQIGRDWNGDIWDLSPEEMRQLRTNVELWERIGDTGKGGYGERLLEKLNDYADQAGKLEELTDHLNESLTQISFDSLYDSFVDTLMDMDASAEDFAEDFSEYMMRAMLTNQIGTLMKDDIEAWYQKFADFMGDDGTLDEDEIKELREDWDALTQQGVELRDGMAAATGYDSTSSTKQEATSGGWQSMGQDTGEELNGRFTALQIAEETTAAKVISIHSQMLVMTQIQTSSNTFLSEIRSMMILGNSYLEDIASYSKKIYVDFVAKLDDLVNNTKNL